MICQLHKAAHVNAQAKEYALSLAKIDAGSSVLPAVRRAEAVECPCCTLLAVQAAAELDSRFAAAQADVMALLDELGLEACGQDVLNPCDASGTLMHWGGLGRACVTCQARVLARRIRGL